MNKKIIIEEKPNIPILPSEIAQGNKNAISKSKIINKIATKQKRTSKTVRASLKGSNPHSYAESFSTDGRCVAIKKDKKKIILDKPRLMKKNNVNK